MILNFFSSRGWQSWDVEHRPLIPEGMPVLIDDDLRFEDGPAAPRPAAVVNRWLRELPASGAPAPSSWENYARVVKGWMEFLAVHGVGLFDSRERLKAGLSRYAEHRAAGPLKARFAATTWGQHMSILSLFYRWAIAEGYATAEPFTYRAARALFAGTGREVRVNLAVRRTPKPHVTIKYLEPDFTELFRNGLRGLAPDGSQDTGFHGRELTRNAAVGDLALATGMRLQEFTYLLPWEIPALPPEPTEVPIPFPVPAGITKGKKFRTTWTSYEVLAGLHDYLELDRAANFCWFIDASRALCLKLAGTPTADRPLVGMCDSARCPQATHHPCHRPVWAEHAERTNVFLGQLGTTRKTERTRLQADYDRALRVVSEIDAARQLPPE
ncbi:site-specific integrase [Streptomyces sp. OE57]|uniref:site-specific integrase n=1 Tax=Streptomyces lacaronensis TaxID=3379885 RepID=UPI0039B7680B